MILKYGTGWNNLVMKGINVKSLLTYLNVIGGQNVQQNIPKMNIHLYK
jgi:hypothetical protein